MPLEIHEQRLETQVSTSDRARCREWLVEVARRERWMLRDRRQRARCNNAPSPAKELNCFDVYVVFCGAVAKCSARKLSPA